MWQPACVRPVQLVDSVCWTFEGKLWSTAVRLPCNAAAGGTGCYTPENKYACCPVSPDSAQQSQTQAKFDLACPAQLDAF